MDKATTTMPKGGRKGVRKDAISHGLYSMVRTRYGTFEAYFSHLDKVMPGKPADMIAKYIPQEIEHINAPDVNVLQIIMPPERLNASDVSELEAPASNVIDVECEE